MSKNTGKKFLSDLKLYSDYLKWKPELNRYETWDEACEDIINGHQKKFPDLDLSSVLESMKEMRILASQRSLQFRGDSIAKHNMRIFNCCVLHACRPRVFQEILYMGLCGCGVGISLILPFIEQLPDIEKRENGTKTFVVEDSIEGWSDALGVLMSSYFVSDQPFPEYAGYQIRFDYSKIRPKGCYISGGFKAPGPEGLQKSLENIEKLLDSRVKESSRLKSINIFDIICFASDAVLSGGVRRSALSMIVDPNDTEMIYAKTGNWRQDNPQRARSNNSVLLHRDSNDKEYFKKLISLNNGDSDIGFVFGNTWFDCFNPCFEIGFTPVNTYEDIAAIKYEDLGQWTKKNIELFGSQQCNLNEINAEKCLTKEQFLRACKDAAILGTVQASYTSFPYMTKVTEELSKREALLGVSITGWMNNPKLFDPQWLREGAALVLEINGITAKAININPAARATTTKPSGNSCTKFSTLIKTNLGDMSLLDIFRYCSGVDSFSPEDSKLEDVTLDIYKKLMVFDENNELQEISGLYINGVQEIFEIEFEDGNVYGFTGNHKLKTTSGWKRVSELTTEDEIISY
jgi:ribonucleoside-diphosphate reductase alpha chain